MSQLGGIPAPGLQIMSLFPSTFIPERIGRALHRWRIAWILYLLFSKCRRQEEDAGLVFGPSRIL